ncbi:hypothetical protein HNP33_002213 [Comamonas odontotermitis]|uniref:Uncharacterized protein n=1 Tax=Comamonas odontotermitis TaxID=379895 RepID=A0ABR6RG57_9BURK|nr:hypothetical protein [Comamonas odontotermitis]
MNSQFDSNVKYFYNQSNECIAPLCIDKPDERKEARFTGVIL